MARPKLINPDEKVRLNLELNKEAHAHLQKLQDETGAASLTEVIRRALAVYGGVVGHVKENGKVVFRFSDGTEEVLRLI